jgi:hypothetical protein
MNAKIVISPNARCSLRLAKGQTFYYCRRYEPLGAAPRIALPQPFRSWISRLLHGSYALNRVTGCESQGPVEFRTTGARHFVACSLRANEEVCFDGRKLAGFEGSVGLRTLISFQLPALSLERMFFQVARGPGLVLFETAGKPEVFFSGSQPTFPASRLVCWTLDSAFAVDVSPHVLDHYFSAAYLRIDQTGGAVIDADDTATRPGNSLVGLLKRVYRPL